MEEFAGDPRQGSGAQLAVPEGGSVARPQQLAPLNDATELAKALVGQNAVFGQERLGWGDEATSLAAFAGFLVQCGFVLQGGCLRESLRGEPPKDFDCYPSRELLEWLEQKTELDTGKGGALCLAFAPPALFPPPPVSSFLCAHSEREQKTQKHTQKNGTPSRLPVSSFILLVYKNR